ncbi:uncharacterized protein PFL1_02783 [Pseudozyma flocculosa PF-1]|uniref:tRNA (guanine(9)-N1)-methyltransferase n=1 Tax=Pseudozyma flocculosa PF-1 TaxID=1277687 RepID=A0A061HAU6_9BASI|nr:uncharacterized protein PFL1_02783 [Pseudozyma flocculosa PF-1]EPQ29564.1 hypothetical protein PFL1_02783 [Pseudozyma flocculosa PF-1]
MDTSPASASSSMASSSAAVPSAGEPDSSSSATPAPAAATTPATPAQPTPPPFQMASSSHPHSKRHQIHIDASTLPPGLSKSAAKKLAKKQYFEETKLDRRRAERDKRKQKKRDQYQQRQQQAAEQGTDAATVGKRKRGKDAAKAKPKRKPFGARLVIDLGFDDLMSEKEVASLGQQVMYLYSSNRTSHRPFDDVILAGRGHVPGSAYVAAASASAPEGHKGQQGQTGGDPTIFDSPTGTWMEGKMRGVWRAWKGITIRERGGLEGMVAEAVPAAPSETPAADGASTSEDVVYLTADTDDTLTCLEEGKTYVIGGIVDKNRYKGLCSNKAARLGVRRAKLPITEENLEEFERRLRAQGETSQPTAAAHDGGAAKKGGYQGRKVLTVNQVVDILLGWTETEDWVEAIGRGIPRRRFEGGDPSADAKLRAEPVDGEAAPRADAADQPPASEQ